jgi:hypothetical protein
MFNEIWGIEDNVESDFDRLSKLDFTGLLNEMNKANSESKMDITNLIRSIMNTRWEKLSDIEKIRVGTRLPILKDYIDNFNIEQPDITGTQFL